MRIDNRKVNGRIMLEPTDVINLWTIYCTGLTAQWLAGVDENKQPINIPDSMAGAYIKTALDAFTFVSFAVVANTGTEQKVLSMPVYTITADNTKLSIDIGEIIAGVMLEIALPSGAITVKESK